MVYRLFFISILAFGLLSMNETSNLEVVEPPRSIAREILQPLGMPLVQWGHQLKENLFFNYAHEKSDGLEALGDWILAPCRYLLGGFNVSQNSSTVILKPSFKYQHNIILKTILSAISFPICALVGSTIKALSYVFRSPREHYNQLKAWKHSYTFESKNSYYLLQGIPVLFSDQKAPCLHLCRPSKLSWIRQKEVEALKKVCDLLNQHQIVFWLDCGSALGAYRYGGMIPWDDDIDISILAEDHDNIKYLLSHLDQEAYEIQDWSSRRHPKTFLKLYIKETKTLIDIYHYTLDKNLKKATYFYSYQDTPLPKQWKRFEEVMTKPLSYDVLFPLKKVNFEGAAAWVPCELEFFLHEKYGEDLSPTMIWDETSQHYLKVKNHPYWSLFQ